MKKLAIILSIIFGVCILGGGITGIVCGSNQSKVNDKVEEQVTLINTTIIPSTVKVISKTAFFVSGLTTITIPSTVEELGIAAFKSSSTLTSVIIENGITKIENYAFTCCTSLSTITIPKSVTVIGIGSFEQCKIENIYYGGTKEDWEKISFDSSWNKNSNVETYTVHFSDGTTESYSHN